MTPPKNAATLKFLDSEEGHQLIQAVKSLSEGLRGLEQFFKNAVPGAFEDSEHSKKHASKKRPRDPDAPKQHQRSEYKETNPGDKPLEVTEIGRRWRELDEKTKAEYAEQAEELKQKYNEDLKVYKAKLQGSPAVVLPPGYELILRSDDSDDDDEVEEIEEHEDEDSEVASEEESVPEPPVKKTKVEKKPESKAEKKVEKKPDSKAEKKVEKKEAKPTPKLTGKPIVEVKDKVKSTPSKPVESSPEKKKKKKSVAKDLVSKLKSIPVEQCCFVAGEQYIKDLEEKKGLVAVTAQCNFSGKRFDMNWIANPRQNVQVLVDAASYCSTAKFDLKKYPADYIVVSFYKMFGFPTGIGALLVKNTAIECLNKSYYGGGTVQSIAVGPLYFSPKLKLYEYMEDGTLPFQQILALQHGFDYIDTRFGTWGYLKDYVSNLTAEAYSAMKNLSHYNGSPVVKFYSGILDDHGPILTFNLLNPDGSFVGYTQVAKLAETENIHIRTGRFCNAGASQLYLNLTSAQIEYFHTKLGHVCGDELDLVEGQPTGAVRISFGFANTLSDVNLWLKFLNTYFVHKRELLQLQVPSLTDTIKIEISKLIIYPIKSCPGIEISNWSISPTGLLYDRYFMLIDLQGKPLTLKKYPKLGKLNLSLVDSYLYISADKVNSLVLSLDDSSTSNTGQSIINSLVCKFTMRGHATSDQANQWFSEYLGQTCKLLRNGINNAKSFANTSQYLMINDASMNRVIRDIGSEQTHVTHKSFRPNICIKNQPEFVEELWIGKYLEYQEFLFKVDELCERCQMVCIDDEGNRHKEPLSTLAKRPRRKGKIIFGVHLTLVSSIKKQIEL
ncbi:hypothetical protein HDV06_004083 [Boothiomyces sp. JEL0866]|nr:hypothetical protein HDV06_004083 [Boothiomyces sp. JEL0866]